MEPKFQTSFIPKKSVDNDSRNRVVLDTETNIFSLAATIVFIVTLLLFGGLYFYKGYLEKQVKAKGEELTKSSEAIQPQLIQKIIDNSSRIASSREVLEKHLATSKLLMFLSDSALKKIRFNDLAYQNKDGVPSVIISGEVQTYNAFAYQQEIISKSEYVSNSSFTDISLGENGNIKFKFSGTIDPILISYKKAMESSITTN